MQVLLITVVIQFTLDVAKLVVLRLAFQFYSFICYPMIILPFVVITHKIKYLLFISNRKLREQFLLPSASINLLSPTWETVD